VSQELPASKKNSQVAAEEPLQKKFKTSTAFLSPKKNDNAAVYEKKESIDSPEAKTKT